MQNYYTKSGNLSFNKTKKENPNPRYRFNFKEMEDEINKAYVKIRVSEQKDDTDNYNIGLSEIYQLLADMMFGILSVNPPKYFVKHNIDAYEEACAFAINIVGRIERKRINWDHTVRQAWTWYVKICSKYYHAEYPKDCNLTVSLDKIFEEIEDEFISIETVSEDPLLPYVYQDDIQLVHRELFKKLMFVLQVYYEKSEITRMMPLVLYSIQYNIDIPDEIAKLRGLFLVTLKRLSLIYSESDRVLPFTIDQSINKSTVTLILLMYLSSEENSTIPIELVSSLDFFSLARLAVFAGGKTLYIPTMDELEAVVTSSMALSEMLMTGSNSKISRKAAKKAIKFKYDIRRLNKYIKSMITTLSASENAFVNYLGTNCETPFFYDLLANLKHISKCQSDIIETLNEKIKGSSPDELMSYLTELDDSEQKLVTFLERLLKLKDSN